MGDPTKWPTGGHHPAKAKFPFVPISSVTTYCWLVPIDIAESIRLCRQATNIIS
jgi:hypothetical protein